MNSETVDLIATDPPFNKGKDFHATPDSLASGAKFQDKWSWEKDVHEEWVDQLSDDYPVLLEAIESARYAHSDGMGAYMCFMAVRLLVLCSQSLFRFADLGDDGLCRGGPDKGCGVIVSAIDVVVDRLD